MGSLPANWSAASCSELHFAFLVFEIEEPLRFRAREEIGTADALLQLVDQQLRARFGEIFVFGLVDLREHRARRGGVELAIRTVELRNVLELRRAPLARSRGNGRSSRRCSMSFCEAPGHRGCSAASLRAARRGCRCRTAATSVPECRSRLAWLRSAGILTPSTFAAVVFVTPEKSRELDPPQKTNVAPIRPRTSQASHFWPCRPSRIRCSIRGPENKPTKIGGADGTRTRDPRRDRPVF